jgi:DNA repair protein RadD
MQLTALNRAMQLRPYQAKLKADVKDQWARGCLNVLAVLPTGGGKTATFSDIIADHTNTGGYCVAIAHRNELVEQMSLALNRAGVKHRIIASAQTVRAIIGRHVEEHGYSTHDTAGRAAVASVDTLLTDKAQAQNKAFLGRVDLWVTDEAHHLLKANKWGKAMLLFPNAKGLGVTATPTRADGKGLGAHNDGVFHALVEGPTMRELITMGYLCDYIRPDGSIAIVIRPDITREQIAACISQTTGDVIAARVKPLLDQADLVGNVVQEYLKHAKGCRGITFALDIEHATHIATAYRAAGVPAEVVSSKTPDSVRRAILKQFRTGQLLQLVNVDLFGEGFDVPACDVVSFARPTQSYSLYTQQFGRAARISEGKRFFTVLDHVGNCLIHGLPDKRRGWTLERPGTGGGGKSDTMPTSHCSGTLQKPGCGAPYEAYLKKCPYCGMEKPPPAQRSEPEHVEGDLFEMEPAMLAILQGQYEAAQQPPVSEEQRATELRLAYMKEKFIPQAIRAHREVIKGYEAAVIERAALREIMALWSGYQGGMPLDVQRRKFWYQFGTTYLHAQMLDATSTSALSERILNDITEY